MMGSSFFWFLLYKFIIINIVTTSPKLCIGSLFRNEFYLNRCDLPHEWNSIHISVLILADIIIQPMLNKSERNAQLFSSLRFCFCSVRFDSDLKLSRIIIIIPFVMTFHWSNEWYRFLSLFFSFFVSFLVFRISIAFHSAFPISIPIWIFVSDSIVILLLLLFTTNQSLKRNEQFSNEFVTFFLKTFIFSDYLLMSMLRIKIIIIMFLLSKKKKLNEILTTANKPNILL